VNHEHAVSGVDLRETPAFLSFYRAHLPAVYAYLHRLCGGDTPLAEDLTQDTFLALVDAVNAGRSDVGDVRWLMTVARHRFLDHARRRDRAARKLVVLHGRPDHDPREPTEQEVLSTMSSLQPLHRLVLTLRYVDDLSVPAVADTIGRSISATNSLLARARTELRAQLGSAT
jgi:RNA polymerase sigma-70 factor (ECF subfamily)